MIQTMGHCIFFLCKFGLLFRVPRHVLYRTISGQGESMGTSIFLVV